MKFCLPHWDALKAEIERLGMTALIAKSSEELHERLKNELESGTTKDTFDPLMGAHNLIVSRALDMVGLELMGKNEDGSEICPLCYLNAAHKRGCKEPGCTWTYDKTWISGPCGLMFDEAKRLGLIVTQ